MGVEDEKDDNIQKYCGKMIIIFLSVAGWMSGGLLLFQMTSVPINTSITIDYS